MNSCFLYYSLLSSWWSLSAKQRPIGLSGVVHQVRAFRAKRTCRPRGVQPTNIKWKTPIAGRGHSSPIVWGKRIFLTTAIEGALVPGAKAVKHMNGEQEFLHPDSIGADRKHTFKVICLDSETGKVVWEQTLSKARLTTIAIARVLMQHLRRQLTENSFTLSSVPKGCTPTT